MKSFIDEIPKSSMKLSTFRGFTLEEKIHDRVPGTRVGREDPESKWKGNAREASDRQDSRQDFRRGTSRLRRRSENRISQPSQRSCAVDSSEILLQALSHEPVSTLICILRREKKRVIHLITARDSLACESHYAAGQLLMHE